MYYTPKHFSMAEWVPEAIYRELGEGAIVLLDDRILRIWDGVRNHFGVPVTINNWAKRGPNPFSQRGLRTEMVAGGAKHGPHFYGRAGDGDVMGYTADRVRAEILRECNAGAFPLITGMETGTSWVHLDCSNRYSPNGAIIQFTA